MRKRTASDVPVSGVRVCHRGGRRVCHQVLGFAAAGVGLPPLVRGFATMGVPNLPPLAHRPVIAIDLPVFGVPACRHKCLVLQAWVRATCNVFAQPLTS